MIYPSVDIIFLAIALFHHLIQFSIQYSGDDAVCDCQHGVQAVIVAPIPVSHFGGKISCKLRLCIGNYFFLKYVQCCLRRMRMLLL
jgi:hypothetical protein